MQEQAKRSYCKPPVAVENTVTRRYVGNGASLLTSLANATPAF